MSDTLERSPVVVVEDLGGDRVSGPKSNVCHPHTESEETLTCLTHGWSWNGCRHSVMITASVK